MQKAHAQRVKAILQTFPKNRKKMLATRDLSLIEACALTGVERIGAQTINGYIADYKALFAWAVKNGDAASNIFEGMSVQKSNKKAATERKAFTTAQLNTMFMHLTDHNSPMVNKDSHRWGTLIAMFTGARLNEVAQLHTNDVRQVGDMWCIDFNDEGENQRLKSEASRRIVPVHSELLRIGFLDFMSTRRDTIALRLFPDFSYSKYDGYGRNLGRWFNAAFLKKLGLKERGLVFHSFRHSMVSLLAQSDVPEPIVKNIVGHEQEGVTQLHYNKGGYKLAQLQEAINKFTF